MAKDRLPEKFETEMGLMKLLTKNIPISWRKLSCTSTVERILNRRKRE
jgi:hypothetical protein